MIAVISPLDLKRRTYIPNLISNESFCRKQITAEREISSGVPLTGTLPPRSCGPTTSAAVGRRENKVWDTHRALWMADITAAAEAVAVKPSGAKRKTSRLAYHSQRFRLKV